MSRVWVYIILSVLSSCEIKNEAEYVNGKQLFNTNNIGYNGEPLDTLSFNVLKDSLYYIDEPIEIRIASASSEYPIITALMDYALTDSSYIDTVTYNIDKNIEYYHVKDDTIIIQFAYPEEGRIKFFKPIIPITRGPFGILRNHNTVEFYINVAEKN